MRQNLPFLGIRAFSTGSGLGKGLWSGSHGLLENATLFSFGSNSEWRLLSILSFLDVQDFLWKSESIEDGCSSSRNIFLNLNKLYPIRRYPFDGKHGPWASIGDGGGLGTKVTKHNIVLNLISALVGPMHVEAQDNFTLMPSLSKKVHETCQKITSFRKIKHFE